MTSNFYHIKKILSQFAVILAISMCFSVVGCGSRLAESTESKDLADEENYKNGTYCADVTYYNPNTGTENTYTLNVEVEERELTKIYWSNGGWLDDSHFSPPEIDDDGSCSFTSDKGYKYTVQITGSECSSTSSGVALEGNDEPEEPTLTLAQCASAMGMTEMELSQYESDFKVSRNHIITETMCDELQEYLQKEREFAATRRSLHKLEQQMEDGYIREIYAVGPDSNNIRCQTMIVKRKGYYYLLEVQGSRKATMGLTDFDPSITDWQEVKILEDPSNPVWRVFYVRVIDQSSEMASLDEEMKTFCAH